MPALILSCGKHLLAQSECRSKKEKRMVIICSFQPGLILTLWCPSGWTCGGWIYAELRAIIKVNHVCVDYTDISIPAPGILSASHMEKSIFRFFESVTRTQMSFDGLYSLLKCLLLCLPIVLKKKPLQYLNSLTFLTLIFSSFFSHLAVCLLSC